MHALFRRSTDGHPPVWLWIFVVVSIAQTGVAMSLHGVSTISLALLPLNALFLWMLLRGGRVIWCLSVAGEVITVIGVAWGESVWAVGVAAAGLALLLAPASRSYVWQETPLRRSRAMANEEARGWGAKVASGALWKETWSWVRDRLVNWGFIGRLAVVVFTAELISGALDSARHHSLLVAVPWWVVDVVGGLGLILLLCLLIAAGVRVIARRILPGPDESAESQRNLPVDR